MLEPITKAFDIPGAFIAGESFGNGLINDTFVVTFRENSITRRYILQRINHHVFHNPISLMRNVQRVCNHICHRLEQESAVDTERRALQIIATKTGQSLHHHTVDGNAAGTDKSFWRCFRFIDGCISLTVVECPEIAYQAARKFGEFQRLVADLECPRLEETIPDFHNTPKRFQALLDAIRADPLGRAAECQDEIDFALAQEPIAHHLLDLHAQGLIPERITHNDTKISNVLIDEKSGEGVCVVDLDTVMPGLSLYDFGDMVRACVSPIPEDGTQLDQVQIRMPVFQALARGFLEEMQDILTPSEIHNLGFAGKLLAYELGLRFLTDHLLGDPYFGNERPNHNLERARNQFQLVRCLESAEPEMNAFVATVTDKNVSRH